MVLKGQLLCCCCNPAFLTPGRETWDTDGWVFLPPLRGQPTCSSQPSQPTLRAKFREPRAVSAPAPQARCSTTRFPRSPLPEGLRKGEGERSLQRTLALSHCISCTGRQIFFYHGAPREAHLSIYTYVSIDMSMYLYRVCGGVGLIK